MRAGVSRECATTYIPIRAAGSMRLNGMAKSVDNLHAYRHVYRNVIKHFVIEKLPEILDFM